MYKKKAIRGDPHKKRNDVRDRDVERKINIQWKNSRAEKGKPRDKNGDRGYKNPNRRRSWKQGKSFRHRKEKAKLKTLWGKMRKTRQRMLRKRDMEKHLRMETGLTNRVYEPY